MYIQINLYICVTQTINQITMSKVIKSGNQEHAAINKEFLIRWKEQDIYYTYLTTARKYAELVGEKLANTHFEKAMAGGKDRYIFKLRENKLRGALEVTFIAK